MDRLCYTSGEEKTAFAATSAGGGTPNAGLTSTLKELVNMAESYFNSPDPDSQDTQYPNQGDLVNPTTPIQTDKLGKDVAIRCEHCWGVMLNPIDEGALVWRSEPIGENMLYTGFHITHRSSHCIDSLFRGAARPLWMPIDWFFKTGYFSLDWFLVPRYDDNGDLIDYDLHIDRESLNRVAIALQELPPPKPPKQPKTPKSGSKETQRNGYVYLIQSPSGHYKIGRTSDPKDRMKTFTVKLPFEVEYVCVIQTDDMYLLEKVLHSRFKDQRVNGEWFNLSPEDVEHIKGLAK